MRISDWSSDVCSSDLPKDQGFLGRRALRRAGAAGIPFRLFAVARDGAADGAPLFSGPGRLGPAPDRWRDNGQRAYARGGADRNRTHAAIPHRSEEHTSELQSLMRISYAVFCLQKKKHKIISHYL